MIRTLTGIVLDGSGTMPHYPQRLNLARGEHATLIIQVMGQDGQPFDLTGYEMILSVPERAIYRGGTFDDPTTGEAEIELSSADTGDAPASEVPYFVFIHEAATGKPFCIIPASPFKLGEERFDPSQTVTTVSPTAQQLVGMPIPVPSYNVRPYFFGGAWRFQQYERAKAVFTNTAQATVTWPTFASRPLEVRAGAPRVTSGSALVVVSILNVTPTGCLVQLSDVITGEVDLEIEEVLS